MLLAINAVGERLARLSLVAAASVLIGVGCNTIPIGAPSTIEIPPGLTVNDAEVAVFALLTEPAPGPQYDSHSDTKTLVLASPLGAMLLDAYRHRSRRLSKLWFVESYTPGHLNVGFQHKAHYMKVLIESTPGLVSLRILNSKNLKQTETRIHKRAKAWLDRLEIDIREALGTASLIKANLIRDE